MYRGRVSLSSRASLGGRVHLEEVPPGWEMLWQDGSTIEHDDVAPRWLF